MSRGNCKYCGAEFSDYREFCDQFCKTDYEEAKADDPSYKEYVRSEQVAFNLDD